MAKKWFIALCEVTLPERVVPFVLKQWDKWQKKDEEQEPGFVRNEWQLPEPAAHIGSSIDPSEQAESPTARVPLLALPKKEAAPKKKGKSLDERLEAERIKLKQLQALQQKKNARERAKKNKAEKAKDTRRKFLVGAILLAREARGEALHPYVAMNKETTL